MDKAQKRSGGKRSNAGRKPTEDKVQSIYIGIKESVVNALGGKKSVKLKAEQYINDTTREDPGDTETA